MKITLETASQYEGLKIPTFGHLLDIKTGKTERFFGYIFEKYIPDPDGTDTDGQVLLSKIDDDGNRQEVIISQYEFEFIFDQYETLTRKLKKYPENSWDANYAIQEYERNLHLDEDKLILNTVENFIHNLRVVIRQKVTSPFDMFEYGRRIVYQMRDYTKKKFYKMRKKFGKEAFDKSLMDEYYYQIKIEDAVSKITISDEEKGNYIGDTNFLRRDIIPIAFCLETFKGDFLQIEKSDYEILQIDKNTNEVLLYSEELRALYRVDIKIFTDYAKKYNKQKDKKNNRFDYKIVLKGTPEEIHNDL